MRCSMLGVLGLRHDSHGACLDSTNLGTLVLGRLHVKVCRLRLVSSNPSRLLDYSMPDEFGIQDALHSGIVTMLQQD